MLIRAQEMTRYVCEGCSTPGSTGLDWVASTSWDRESHILRRASPSLVYSKQSFGKVRLGAGGPEDSRLNHRRISPAQRLATELVQVTRSYFEKLKVPVKRVEFSWGATEVKPPVLCRRHRRSDGNRLDAARQPAAHSRTGAGIEHAADRNHAALAGHVEENQDRQRRAPAERPSSAGPRRPDAQRAPR
jgi:hypothetical protein